MLINTTSSDELFWLTCIFERQTEIYYCRVEIERHPAVYSYPTQQKKIPNKQQILHIATVIVVV